MSPLVSIGAALFAALAAWVGQGTIGFASEDGVRLAVLPVSAGAFLVAAAAGIAIGGLHRLGGSPMPVALLGLVMLPWLPVAVPAAFMLWVAPVTHVVWAAVLLLMLGSVRRPIAFDVRHPRLAAAVLAGLIFGVSAWRAAPMLPGGDEPHYLVITQSLLLDGDLSIEEVHRRGDYRAYYTGDLPPHVQRRGRDGQIYSVHAPGLPVLVAPAFAVGGYPAVVVFLVLLASAGSAQAWHVAWLATRRRDAAWFGWAAVTLPVTAIFQSVTVYPDGPGGVLVLTGVWALLRARDESTSTETRAAPWLLHGGALALLPWLHSRFAVLAACLGALVLLRLSRTKNPAAKAVAFLAVPAVSAILWLGYFIAIYGVPDPSAPYGAGEIGSFRFVPGGLAGLLFDQRFGVIAYAPVVAVAFAGAGVMLTRQAWRPIALELLFVVVPYLLTVTHFAMWWGGWSPPARFFAPILPLFVIPGAVAWTVMPGRVSRWLASIALALTAIASMIVIGIDRGRLAFNTRDAPALWLDWLSRVADLTTAAPRWARETDTPLFVAVAIWIAVLALSVLALRFAERSGRLRQRAALPATTVAVLCVAVMIASSAVWAVEGSTGRSTIRSQLRLLETIAARPDAFALALDGWSPIRARDIAGRVRIGLTRHPSPRSAGRETLPLFALPPLPAGHYRLAVSPEARGWVMVGIARDQFALRTAQLPAPPVDLTFPLPVRGLVIGGDEEARRSIRALTIEPVHIFRYAERLTTQTGRRAARYALSTVFFVDDKSFPEPEAFWVGGSTDSTVVILPDVAAPSARVRLRNGPMNNRVTFAAGAWRKEVQLTPGEEQDLDIPLDPVRRGQTLRVETSAGFRPSDRDPRSRDHRFLGVWIRVNP